ncbi:MAG: acyltransferase family protein [Acidimicrobiales bacterium]
MPAATVDRRLPYQPSLDGLRGLAVAGVVLFHLGYPWARGGYLGVSVFFTLSGFLITSVLLAERADSARTDLRRFWSRRARRLLPAALCGLALAAAVSRTLPSAPQGVRLDLFAALGDVANWRFLLAGRSYADLFSSPSPTLHFWSLSIEEQFYLCFPVVFVVAARRALPTRSLLRACLVGTAVSWLALVVAGALGAHDFAYYATFTRAGELLVGAAAAVVIRRLRRCQVEQVGWPRQLLDLGALAALLVLCTRVEESSSSLERGVLPLVAILSTTVVVGACRPGMLSTALSWHPIVGLGRISYGVYVYHWPLLLWLTAARTGLHGFWLNGLRVAVTLGVSVVSFVALEQPVRRGRWPRAVVAPRVVAAAVAAAALVIALVTPTSRPTIDLTAAAAALQISTSAGAQPRTDGQAAGPAPSDQPRVAIFGDSTALMTGMGLSAWASATRRIDLTFGDTPLGCSITRGGERRYQGGEGPTTAECNAWADRWPDELVLHPVDIAVIQVGPWEVADRKLAGDDRWRHVGDPTFDAYARGEMLAAVDLLLQHVKVVVWLTGPDIRTEVSLPVAPSTPPPEDDPARMAHFNSLVREVAAARPLVRVVDLNAHLASLPGGEMDLGLRPDGVHFSNESTQLVAPWIAEQILAASA